MFKFKGNETLDSLSSVPTEYHGLYVKGADSKFVLSDAAKPLAYAYDGVNAQSATDRAALATATGKQGELTSNLLGYKGLFTKHGIALEDAQNPIEILDAHLANAAKGLKGAVDLDKVRGEHTRAIQDIEKKNGETISKKDRLIQKYLVNQALTAAISEAKGDTKWLPGILASKLKVVEDGEDLVVRVVDDAGQARTDGKGGMLTVKGLVEETKMNPDFGKFFDSDTPAGTGHRPASSKQPASVARAKTGKNDPSEMSSVDNITAGLSAGQFTKGAGTALA